MSLNGQAPLVAAATGPTAMVLGSGTLPAGHWFDQHRHPQHQIAWASRGVLAVQIDGGIWVLPPTRALWIPGGIAHRTGTSAGADMRGIFIEPDRCPIDFPTPTLLRVGRLLHELFDYLTADSVLPGPTHTPAESREISVPTTTSSTTPTRSPDPDATHEPVRPPDTPDPDPDSARVPARPPGSTSGATPAHPRVRTHGRDGDRTPMANAEDRRRRGEAVVFDLIEPVEVIPVGAPLPSDPRARVVAEALLRHPADDRTLEQFAPLAAASPRTLARAFLAETGITFGQWRTQIRLAASLPLLAAELPVARIAERVGYSTPSAYVAAFRRAVGISPGRYFAR
ncbi:AraC family transcriptional regulator [Nocardia pseudobrasiliensis]|uniref:HTH-type transcriptional regulator RipA n=1 Tax=Nocardia pseudobrasiliensis TaxID=45979 RepID=A0A370I1T8_9NOCA|nr:helix-turn-helix transcriptional regulator [Nocardia pseudobrasiliensis]RDI64695.1 AraC-like DNA-binding protein [Nocardia pseudobrasiliensis]